MKITVKKLAKKENEYKLEIVGTAGWLLAIGNALVAYSGSPIAEEVLQFYNLALRENKETERFAT